MIKVRLHGLQISNILTGHSRLDCVIIDGNEVLCVEKPDSLQRYYKDEIKAKALKLDLGIIREQIAKRKRNPKYSNFDDMETLRQYRAETEDLQKEEKKYETELNDCESIISVAVYSGVKVNILTGEETIVNQLELPEYTKLSVNKAHIILDLLALDERKLAYDSEWLTNHGYGVTIHTTPGAPVEMTGDKTFEQLVLALAE